MKRAPRSHSFATSPSAVDPRAAGPRAARPPGGAGAVHPTAARLGLLSAALAALLAPAAVAPLIGCDGQTGPTKVQGTVFPPATGSTVKLLDATDVIDLDQTLDTLAQQTLVDGAYGPIFLDLFAEVMLAEAQGGTIATFTSPTSTTAVPLAGKLRALFTPNRGGNATVNPSPLSTISAFMATGLQLSAGRSLRDAIAEANGSLGGYFSVGASVAVPSTAGVALWDASGAGARAIDGGVLAGLVTAGLTQRVNAAAGIATIEDYCALLGKDAADGVVDGLVHPPFAGGGVQTIAAALGAVDYPVDPLGTTLATDIEDFLAAAVNRSSVSGAEAANLLARLRLVDQGFVGTELFGPAGIVLGGVPVIDSIVVDQPQPGSVTISSPLTVRNFVIGANVLFANQSAAAVTVVDAATIVADIPASVSGTVFVTVVNPDGKRHSQSATLP